MINRIAPTRRGKAALAGATGLVALTVGTLIKPWEGRELIAYQDMVKIWSICEGDTKNVRPGQRATNEECDRRLYGRIQNEFLPQLRACTPGFDRIPLSLQASLLSLSWNVGTTVACKSTAVRLARAGQWRESCEAATAFNRAGGQVVGGLVNRREMGDAQRIGEAELCVSGL